MSLKAKDKYGILNSITKSARVRVADKVDIFETIVIVGLIDRIFSLLKDDSYQSIIDLYPTFIISIKDEEAVNETIFSSGFLKRKKESGYLSLNNVLEINLQGVLLKSNSNQIIEHQDDLYDISENNFQNLYIMVEGNRLVIIFKGRNITTVNNIFDERIPRKNETRISINKTNVLIERYLHHFNTNIQPSKYWSKKKDRVLRRKPEQLLASYLFDFFQDNIADGVVDQESLIDNSDDKIDIKVVEYEGRKIHLYEVKWIGRSEGTQYIKKEAHKRANDGIEQLKIYISKEHNCKKAVLVIYDARKEDEMEEIHWLESEEWNLKIHNPPCLIHLDSESASVSATRIVKEKFKNIEKGNKN